MRCHRATPHTPIQLSPAAPESSSRDPIEPVTPTAPLTYSQMDAQQQVPPSGPNLREV